MIYESRVSKTDLFGNFFLSVHGSLPFQGYYTTLKQLVPLLKSEDFLEYQTGYYINSCGNFNGVRLSYFTDEDSKNKLTQIVNNFAKAANLDEISPPEEAGEAKVSKVYGGEQYEQRFREYLSLETQIGMEILDSNPSHSKSLMATYRWQVFATRSPIKHHIEPTLLKCSQTFNSLSDSQREQFWKDVGSWPNPPQVDWTHFLVNLVLACDWNWLFSKPPFTPLSIEEMNERHLKKLGFAVNPDWTPFL